MSDREVRSQTTNQPLRNLFRLLISGRFTELLKVLKRRSLNAVQFFYNHPALLRRRQQKQLLQILRYDFGYSGSSLGTKKIRIAIIAREGPTYPKSSAFIRLIAPLTSQPTMQKVHLELFAENTTELPADIDICIVQRTAFDSRETAKALLENLKVNRTPLIIDTDDAFNVIDPAHPEHSEHKDRVSALDYLISSADQVWISVQKLNSYLPKPKGSIVVMPNSLDSRIWRETDPIQQLDPLINKPLQLLYMGTVTHDADLDMILPPLKLVAQKYPGSFVLTVIGVSSDLPNEHWIKRSYQKRGAAIYPKFVKWFLKQGPFDIGLSPLVDNEFNRCKSDIKCLDYLAAGIVPMVSDIEPYQTRELNNYIIRVKNTKADWAKQLEAIVSNMPDFRRKKLKITSEAQKYIWQKRSSETLTRMMLKEFKKLNILD